MDHQVCQRLYEEFTRLWQVIGPLPADSSAECQEVYVKFLDAWEAVLLHGSVCGNAVAPASTPASPPITTTSSSDMRYICEECGNRYYSKKHLTTHRVSHSHERPFQCLECGNRYKLLTNLLSHTRTHTNSGRHGEAAELLYSQQPQLKRSKC